MYKESKFFTSQYTWDQYFMTMAYLVSMRSKDPSTRVGAVIVGHNNEVRSTGYNGLPVGVTDVAERYEDVYFKSIASNHAEENAILHCARIGVPTQNCTMYTIWQPCAMCSKMIIQTGIKKVVFDKMFPGNDPSLQENWKENMAISIDMLLEAGVEVMCVQQELVNIEGLYKSKKFDPFAR